MRIISWNVNGLRACIKKGFLDFLSASNADVLAIQEVRAFRHQLDPAALETSRLYIPFRQCRTTRLQRGGYLFPATA